jgi:hypothetical protein
MHISVFIYLLFDQYNPINWICTKKRKSNNLQRFQNPKTPTYKYIYLFILLFSLIQIIGFTVASVDRAPDRWHGRRAITRVAH